MFMKWRYAIIILFVFCSYLVADETTNLFRTFDELERNSMTSEIRTNECLPASEFPEGNWGNATNGLQVSLRFDKATYTNNEPITATILVRNVSTNVIDFMELYVSEKDGPIRFFATTEDDHRVEPIEWRAVEPLNSEIQFGSQRKFVERFDKDYKLTNGTFYIQAYVMPIHRRAYIESAKVPIHIAP
jgi:hypothetical protein